jgi:hypothetical protein
MNRLFAAVIESLEPSYRRLLGMTPVKATNLPPDMPVAGVYLFTEEGRHLYVGRSKGLRGRIQRHSRPGATHRMAAFAFRLAREATGELLATYKAKGSRRELAERPRFRNAFARAKARIRSMDVRFVPESDPIRQAVLEMYVAVAVGAPYNEFATH